MAAAGKTEQIVDALKGWISDQELRPGDFLPTEKDLIAYFCASRGSVREALRALCHQGLIRMRRGQGGGPEIAQTNYERTAAFLRGYLYFDQLTWAQIYEARGLIEPGVARRVASRLTSEDFAALEATVAIGEGGAGGDKEALRQAEIEFHAILARRSDNPLLSFMARFINSVMSELTVTYNVIDPGGEVFHKANLVAHRQILDALRCGDGPEIEALMARHIEEAGCFVCAREHAHRVDLRL